MTPMKMRFLSVSVLISAHPWSPSFRRFRDFCFYWFRPKAGLGLIRGSWRLLIMIQGTVCDGIVTQGSPESRATLGCGVQRFQRND